MSLKPLKWEKKWGPPKLRQIVDWLVDSINERTPRAGIGLEADESKNGVQLSLRETNAPTNEGIGGTGGVSTGGSGTPTNIYGSFNGAPAVFNINTNSITLV